MMDHQVLLDTLKSFGRPRVLVLGDLILDRYTWGNASRISQEAPVLVLKTEHQEHRLGGAANVANMVATLGAEVHCAGVVGTDLAGETMRSLLQEAGVNTDLVWSDPQRPTSLKERFMGKAGARHANQILRVDHESDAALPTDLDQALTSQLVQQVATADAVLIADYAKGCCTPAMLRAVLDAANNSGCPVLVDPGHGRDLTLYRQATLLKPNRHETAVATGRPVRSAEDALAAGEALCREVGFQYVCVTLDADGMALTQASQPGQLFPTQARAVYDITGAGDMVLAMLGFGFAERLPAAQSVLLANVAAGLEVEKNGVAVVTREEIASKLVTESGGQRPKLVTLEQVGQLAEAYHRGGQKIVFTNGCFDLLHVGHVTYLEEAAALGDVLIVGVNGDDSVRRLKGPQRPVISQADRAAMLAALACVDHVSVFDSDTPHPLLHAIRPDVLVKGGTYRVDEVVGHEFVASYGGQIAVTGMIDGVSTTRIVNSLTRQSAASPPAMRKAS